MKNRIVASFILFLLNSCGTCPDPNYIEFDNAHKTIALSPKGYYIKSVIITEYIQKDGYIELIDSNRLVLDQIGARAAYNLTLLNPGENYIVEGMDYSEISKAELLQYEVHLMKYENRKTGDEFDEDVITFVSAEIKEGKSEFNSKRPCP